MKIFKLIAMQVVIGSVVLAFSGQQEWSTMAIYDNKIPENIVINKKYLEVPDVVDYVFVRARTANMRDLPSIEGNVIKKYPYDTKLKAIKKVSNYGNIWFYVEDINGNKGYISANVVRKRMFRFQKALDKIMELEEFLVQQKGLGRELASTNSYIPNPDNQNF